MISLMILVQILKTSQHLSLWLKSTLRCTRRLVRNFYRKFRDWWGYHCFSKRLRIKKPEIRRKMSWRMILIIIMLESLIMNQVRVSNEWSLIHCLSKPRHFLIFYKKKKIQISNWFTKEFRKNNIVFFQIISFLPYFPLKNHLNFTYLKKI